jgi:large subunit ribosomal protein L15
MAELHDLSPVQGSTKNRKRVGRGPGSGSGKTAGRGQKGQKSRSGGKVSPGFEGGQMPLQRRIPKRGFHNVFRTEYQVVNVRDLEGLEGDVGPEALHAHGLIGHGGRPVKILGEGEIGVALNVSAHAFSRSARAKIEGAGGSVTVLGRAEQDVPAAESTATDDEPATAEPVEDDAGEAEAPESEE